MRILKISWCKLHFEDALIEISQEYDTRRHLHFSQVRKCSVSHFEKDNSTQIHQVQRTSLAIPALLFNVFLSACMHILLKCKQIPILSHTRVTWLKRYGTSNNGSFVRKTSLVGLVRNINNLIGHKKQMFSGLDNSIISSLQKISVFLWENCFLMIHVRSITFYSMLLLNSTVCRSVAVKYSEKKQRKINSVCEDQRRRVNMEALSKIRCYHFVKVTRVIREITIKSHAIRKLRYGKKQSDNRSS